MNRLASANLLTLNSCKIYARKNKGLAFSFLPEGTEALQDNDEEETTCNVFECPEFESTLTLQHTSAYHYYSLYAQPLPNLNVTCVPGVGVFTIHFKRVNYTLAQAICEENGGHLANILSDQRTRLLAELLYNLGEHKKNIQAYIGLDDIQNEGTFVSANGQLLECTMYRAWAPGEPHAKKKDEDCVVLNSRQMWQVVRCNKELPFICEISPSGPINLCSNSTLAEKRQCLIEHINRTEIMKENSRCLLPPLYEKNATDMLAEIENVIDNMNNSTVKNV